MVRVIVWVIVRSVVLLIACLYSSTLGDSLVDNLAKSLVDCLTDSLDDSLGDSPGGLWGYQKCWDTIRIYGRFFFWLVFCIESHWLTVDAPSLWHCEHLQLFQLLRKIEPDSSDLKPPCDGQIFTATNSQTGIDAQLLHDSSHYYSSRIQRDCCWEWK